MINNFWVGVLSLFLIQQIIVFLFLLNCGITGKLNDEVIVAIIAVILSPIAFLLFYLIKFFIKKVLPFFFGYYAFTISQSYKGENGISTDWCQVVFLVRPIFAKKFKKRKVESPDGLFEKEDRNHYLYGGNDISYKSEWLKSKNIKKLEHFKTFDVGIADN